MCIRDSISSTAIKMVELSDDGRGGYKLEGYSSAPLPKDAIVDGNIGDLEKVADAIKQAWKLLGSREKRVALALPASAVILSLIHICFSCLSLRPRWPAMRQGLVFFLGRDSHDAIHNSICLRERHCWRPLAVSYTHLDVYKRQLCGDRGPGVW